MKINNIQDIQPNGSPVVFVTGVTGQDGSHMVDHLLKTTNAFVVGGARRLSNENHTNINHLENHERFQLVNFDLTDTHSIYKVVEVARPDYFINFAAQTFVASSWDFARQTWECNTTAVLDCLEAIKRLKPNCRFYNAGSSEEFGDVLSSPQNEETPLRPRSPYGASKAAARQLIKVYRESYGLYAVQGWLFNHEGTRRGEEFVTRKITKGVARIKQALLDGTDFEPIELGNLDAFRDWSDAEDMIDAIWRMVNQEKFNKNYKVSAVRDAEQSFKNITKSLQEYVVSSGETHNIREFVECAFKAAGITGCWFINTKNDPLTERYTFWDDGVLVPDKVLVKVNPKFYRPAEVQTLQGDSSRIVNELGWSPKVSFNELVEKMVYNDCKHIDSMLIRVPTIIRGTAEALQTR